eukprot:scaffold43172_cov49-Phaeocystis_antarctica.AAC.2
MECEASVREVVGGLAVLEERRQPPQRPPRVVGVVGVHLGQRELGVGRDLAVLDALRHLRHRAAQVGVLVRAEQHALVAADVVRAAADLAGRDAPSVVHAARDELRLGHGAAADAGARHDRGVAQRAISGVRRRLHVASRAPASAGRRHGHHRRAIDLVNPGRLRLRRRGGGKVLRIGQRCRGCRGGGRHYLLVLAVRAADVKGALVRLGARLDAPRVGDAVRLQRGRRHRHAARSLQSVGLGLQSVGLGLGVGGGDSSLVSRG